MTPVEIAKRARVAALALSLLLQPVAQVGSTLVLGAAAGSVVVFVADDAQAKSRSSGGYSRPSVSSSSSIRTPSFGGSSGGYSKPSAGSSGLFGSSSAGDRAMTRQGSGSALDSYRQKQNADRTPSTAPQPLVGGTTSGGSSRGYSYTLPRGSSDYYRGHNWAPPVYAGSMSRGFGMWDAMFLWFMLDTITRPSHAAFFHNNQNDPGYQQWRTEADKLAADNADLKAKLGTLDAELAKQKGQPVTPGAVPDDVPKAVAVVAGPESGGSSSGWIGWIVLVVGGIVLWRLWRGRKRLESEETGGKEERDMSMFGTAGNYVARKLSGEAYKPSLFRVGMTVTIDPSPFILAGSKIKAVPPDGTGPVSVEAVGTVKSGAATVHRLYLSEDRFVQIHLDDAGVPDECRYFSVVDEVDPADEEEWGFWLDSAEGMIGWSEFQTKDGKVYPRAWSPGLTRIEPFKLQEAVERAGPERTITESAMLYAAPSGAAAPADKEYILVSAVEEGDRAWVRIAAGIDINPASLGLA